GAKPDAVALVLARANAEEVSNRFPDTLVIGSDQTMSLCDSVFHKPKDMTDAASHLQARSPTRARCLAMNSAVSGRMV
ncbi:Maf family protein, partial [Rhizobium ruizarguesonis]